MSSSFHADLDGGAVIPPENIKAICSELKYNPKTRLLRFCAPKTKLEHKAGRKKYPDYTPYETKKSEEFASAAEYEFKTDEPYSSEYQTSASESYESSSATAEEASDSEENAESGDYDDDDDGGANQDASEEEEETSGGRSVRFSERRYEDKEPPTTRAGTPAPERKNAEKNVSPDRVRAAAATSSERNRKSEKNEKKAQTIDKSAKRAKRSRNDAKSDDDRQSFTAGGSGADDDDDENADERFSGSVDRRAVPRVCSAKSGGRSRSKRSNNSSAGANKREKRAKICNPFTSRSKSTRRDVESAFGRRTSFKTSSAAAAVPVARVKGGDTDNEYSEPVRRRIGRIIEAGVVPPDNDVGRKRRRGATASKRKSTHGAAATPATPDDDDEWAPGKAIPADPAAYW